MARGTVEKKTYLNIMQGKVVERLHKDTKYRAESFDKKYLEENFPGIETYVREYLDDKGEFVATFIEQRDDFVSGYVESLIVESGDYGPIIKIEMNDGEEKFIVQMKQNSSTGLYFMKCFPNVNPAVALKLNPWKSQNGEGITLSQDHKKVEPMWHKDDMGDYPLAPDWASKVDYNKWTPKQRRDYDTYKNTRLDFLEEHLQKHAELFGPYDGSDEDEMQKTSDANAASLELTEKEKKGKARRGSQVDTPEGTKEIEQTTLEDPDDDLPF